MNLLESAFRLVLEISWRSTLVIVAFMALRRLFHGQVSAGILFWVWIALAARLVIPLSVPAVLSPFNLMRLAHRGAAGEIPPPAPGGNVAAPAMPAIGQPASTQPVATRQAASPWSPSPFLLAAAGWALGVVVLAAGRLQAHRSFARRLLRAGNADHASVAAQAAAEDGGRSVRVIVTDSVGAPALYGIFRPMLLFPPGLLERLSPDEIRMIVSHELCHHRRRDLVAHALIHLSQVVHWFNPVVWIAGRAARHDCELACDEQVVRGPGPMDPQAYGAALLKIFSLAGHPPDSSLAVGIVESKTKIKRRIQMIIANRAPSPARTFLGWALFVLVAGLGITRESNAQQTAPTVSAAPTQAPAITEQAPAGWWKNGSETQDYVVGMDPSQAHDGQPSAYVRAIKPGAAGFCGMMQMCQADKFIGKRLSFNAWMKTLDVDARGAHLWFRVDGKEKDKILQFDNMDGRRVVGTTGWQRYSVVLDVPAGASALAFGFFISGGGQAWVSGVKLEEVGLDVPSTNFEDKKSRALPDAPVNLEFSGAPLSAIPFVLGPLRFQGGDTIQVEQVQASSPDLKVGDRVVVRGQYRLASGEKARLCLHLAQFRPGGDQRDAPGQFANIRRGDGTFEVSITLTEPGALHLAYNPLPGGEVFGTRAQMDHVKDWQLSI